MERTTACWVADARRSCLNHRENMTLIVVLANQQQVVQLSDRRLTNNGRMATVEGELEDESNKAAVFICRNARLAVAYTGLAKAGHFLTKRWLPAALMESAAPDFLIMPTIDRFRKAATRDFASLHTSAPSDKRFSVVLVGYCYDEVPPRCYCWLVSNYDGLDGQPPHCEASHEFSAQVIGNNRPARDDYGFVLVLGGDQAVSERDFASLRTLLLEKRPAQALVGKGVDVLRAAAESARSEQLIGKQCTSIVLPSNPSEEAVGEYHSAKVAHKRYYPSIISARGDGSGVFVLADPEIEARDADDLPRIISVPKVGRNQLCPCGSGVKYKMCHGCW
jgi:hypothetical protein